MNNPPAVVDMDYSKLQPSGLRRRSYSIYARPVKLDPPFVPRAGEYVRHRGGSVGRVRRTYCRNGVGWRSYVEFFCPNHWYHHVSTEDLSPLSLLEVIGGCCRIGCRGEGGTFLMSFGPRHRPKGFRGGPGPNNLRDLADQKAENKQRQEREKAYCNLFPVGTLVACTLSSSRLTGSWRRRSRAADGQLQVAGRRRGAGTGSPGGP